MHGVTGSGKSTAAVALGRALVLPVHLVDEEFGWLPGWVQRPAEEQREQQEQEQRELSGSLASLIEKAQKAYADAQAALEANPVDWAKYGEAQKALKEALDELGRARAALPTAQPTVPPTAEPTPEATPAPSPSPTG